ncbi:MAG TPA: cupin domain-containing protein [Gaiellaceae bacterium]|nr:cupin domain-containing protein [Gaiellaceae bacterium]
MAALGTLVVDESDVAPVRRDGDTASVRVTFDASTGCERLEQRVIDFGPGRSADRRLEGKQEVLYVVGGAGQLHLEGEAHPVEPGTGVFVAPGETWAIETTGADAVRVVSVVTAADGPRPEGGRKVTVRFDDQPELEASSERSFRYLVNEEAGCVDVTQFLGIVQPSKAPFHSHPYDEVGYVVEGEGVAHVGGRSVPLKAGSCFHLPPDEVHCIENSGSGPMQILGVFHPSGSPANRAYPDNNEAGTASQVG